MFGGAEGLDRAAVATRETFADNIKSQIAQLQERVGNVTERLCKTADSAFGEIESGNTKGTGERPCRSGRFGDLADALDYLAEQVGYLEAHASRFDYVA